VTSGYDTYDFLYDPTGKKIASPYQGGQAVPQNLLNATVLPVAGTYTLEFDPPYADSGKIQIQIFGSYLTAAPVAEGAAVSVTIPTTALGKKAKFTFAGKAGQTVYANGNATTGFDTYSTLYDPTGKIVGTDFLGGTTSAQLLLAPVVLTTTGTYTLEMDPPPADSGVIKVQILASFATATAVVGGAAATVTIPTAQPEKLVRITFTAKAGQSVSVWGADSTAAFAFFTLKDSTGTAVASGGTASKTLSSMISSRTLATAGTYTLECTPPGGFTARSPCRSRRRSAVPTGCRAESGRHRSGPEFTRSWV